MNELLGWAVIALFFVLVLVAPPYGADGAGGLWADPNKRQSAAMAFRSDGRPFWQRAAARRLGRRKNRFKEATMAVFPIWESRFPASKVPEGVEVTQRIWSDMPSFPGYLKHKLIQDVDDPGHLVVVSEWDSKEAADKSLRDYASHPNAATANTLATEPRRRTVGVLLPAGTEHQP